MVKNGEKWCPPPTCSAWLCLRAFQPFWAPRIFVTSKSFQSAPAAFSYFCLEPPACWAQHFALFDHLCFGATFFEGQPLFAISTGCVRLTWLLSDGTALQFSTRF